jgi:Nuclease subunit of the excinuclease complex
MQVKASHHVKEQYRRRNKAKVNENAREHIEKILANMTTLPGVYRMLGKDGELLYVGKAKNLKNRVSSYFVKTIEHPKTQALVPVFMTLKPWWCVLKPKLYCSNKT